MTLWPSIQLGDICTPVERYTKPVPGLSYRQLGIRLWGEGAYEREKIDGSETKYAKFNRIESDDLVVNKIWARNGAVALATSEQAGTYVSPEFPTFILDQKQIDPQWMKLITKWRGFWALCDQKAQGTSGKNRIKPNEFLSIRIPLPSLTEQQIIVDRINDVALKSKKLEEHLIAIERDAEHLLAIRFHDAIAGAQLRSMEEIAPLIRREQLIDLNGMYPELGIRSFGKGTFHKPALAGTDVGTKRLYRIEPGDLLFSNVFAWEGAIAVARAEDSGRFGSHRFISCEVNKNIVEAEFLRYYFLTTEGLLKINEASPGGAGRNRTLGLKKLMAIKVPVPESTEQEKFRRLQIKIDLLKARHSAIREANSSLLPAMLERIFI
ncbi:restriction endonuclease subunit S [Enterobacter chuandaensis]|uniref:restriction endonuclease subunit S n=1 Tax=Enterobacter chuandaensis TaxID=2497875 RepID=UPI003878034E